MEVNIERKILLQYYYVLTKVKKFANLIFVIFVFNTCASIF